ncbi:MAG: hypothetical protein NC177_02610 [Ruminococcus flavefaciens]|nr:hypothetical protein [Ruminococcus flavefaciens]
MSIRKKVLAMAVVAGLVSAVSCGAEPEDSQADEVVTTTVETTQAITESETEPETEEETTTAETEPETEEETTEPETETEEEEREVLTNAELLSLINNVFGMISDGTFENDLQTAISWDIVDSTAEIDPEAEITAEFLVSASVRATGILDGSNSLDEIVSFAVEKGIISSSDLSAIDLSKAVDIVNSAYHAWTNQEFDTEINIELGDNVIDLTGILSTSDFEVNGNTIKLPAEVAENIDLGSVFILPDDNGGTAYTADAIIDNGDGTITINGSYEDFTQIDGSIGTWE